jgi:hypothetical protein
VPVSACASNPNISILIAVCGIPPSKAWNRLSSELQSLPNKKFPISCPSPIPYQSVHWQLPVPPGRLHPEDSEGNGFEWLLRAHQRNYTLPSLALVNLYLYLFNFVYSH